MLESRDNFNINNFDIDKRKVTAAQSYRAFQILKNYRQNNFVKYYKINSLEKIIFHRFNLSNYSTVEKYLEFLVNSDAEKNSIYNYLIPSKKDFFSNCISWQSLVTNVIPKLLIKIPIEEVIRCWVIGCGTGEEAYSLAILLDEAISSTIPFRKFKILATDINNLALKIASEGVYSQKIVDNVSSERLKRYFVSHKNTLTVSHELRKNIVFTPHNIFKDIGFFKINLIICQNFLIYIQPQYRYRVLSTIDKSLAFDGILFLDNYELLQINNKNFVRLQYPGVFFQKRKQKGDRSVSRLNAFQSQIDEALLSIPQSDLHELPTSVFGSKLSQYQNIDWAEITSIFQDLELELKRDRETLQGAIEELRLKQIRIEKINQELITVNKNVKAINQKYQSQLEILQEVNTDLENLLCSVDIGVIFLDRQLKIRRYNSSAQKVFNFIFSDIGRSIKDLKHNLDCSNLVEVLEQFVQTQSPEQLEVQNLLTAEFFLIKLHRYFSRSQQQYRSKSSFSNESRLQSCEGVILTFVDISSRKQAEKVLAHQAFYDSLTKLPNRLLFKEQLQHAVTRLPRQDSPFLAVLYLDLNGFKEVNDTLGHSAGDFILIETARRLNEISRSNDIVSRLGGDEFIILLEEIDRPEQTLEICSRIHKILSLPFQIEDRQVNISTSIGVAIHSSQNNLNGKIETLIENADMAMYRSKQKGTAQTEIFSPQMRAKLEAVTQIKDRLQRAFEKSEFLLYYQPIFCLQNGTIKGLEALLRWEHPDLGLIAPKDFLPVIQNSALFFKLELWIVKQACYQLQQWLQKFDISEYFSFSINISPQLLSHVDFLSYVDDLLDEEGKIAKYLTIEITETALIDNKKAVEEILQRLRSKKIKIALDDFGTGFSSLSHLHSFSLDIIKIDRSFVTSLAHNQRSAHILRSIIYMSQQLDLTIVAEGIESLDQLQWLQEYNCQFGQGYFWSPPISSAATTKLLNS